MPGRGWLYVAFVIDTFAKWIVGWRASSNMTTDFVLDALEQALYDWRPKESDGLIHHSDRGSQYVSWFNHQRLLESIGDVPPAEAEERYYRQLTVQAAEPILL